jgi:two-component system sensor histidine kinase/response regulator
LNSVFKTGFFYFMKGIGRMNRKNRILIVDDTEMNRAMLMKIFEEEYTVLSAKDGREAMCLLEDNEVDLVLLDLAMPGMDGYEVIRAMKSDQRLEAIPIVVETEEADKSERRALDLGADDFISRPFEPDIIRRRVENLIQRYVLQLDNLRQALGQTEQLNRAKSALLSRLGHELRTQVNAVISLASLLKDYDTDREKIDEFGEKIVASLRYMLKVVNDVLDTSAIENQKIVITRSPFDLRRQMEAIAAMFYEQCREKKLQFELDLADFTDEYLFGDHVHLKDIMVSLISNAVKFTPSGGRIMVRVCQLSRVAAMVKLRFEVADTGDFGLSSVKNIVELMGGQINMQSAEEKGNTFIVDLPFTIAREMPEISNDRLKEVRALIVEDDKETQEYGCRVMGKMGITCDVAETGESALVLMKEAFNQSRGYDVCFINWNMPGMSGIEITRQIRAIFEDDTIIVVASAYDITEIKQEARMAGANLVIPKSMLQSTIFDLIMKVTGVRYYDRENQNPGCDFTGKKVLVAEDNALNAEAAMRLLQRAGFQTERAVNGSEVCMLFERSPMGTYDAILMDNQMPFLSGIEAARHIRRSGHPQAKSIPIIAVTANAFTEDVRASLHAGMNDHIAKPIDAGRLYQVLDKLVGQSKKITS